MNKDEIWTQFITQLTESEHKDLADFQLKLDQGAVSKTFKNEFTQWIHPILAKTEFADSIRKYSGILFSELKKRKRHSPSVQTQLSDLPTPLYRVLHLWKTEDPQQIFRSVHRLIDCIEVFCKIYTVASVSQLIEVIHRLISESGDESRKKIDEVRLMLATGLKTPSLGIWWMFARESTFST